jgi:hypothetical protein
VKSIPSAAGTLGFLMIQRDPGSVPRQLNVILNWSGEFDRPAPDARRDERGQ